MNLSVKKINEDSIIPSYGSEYAAGLDLHSYGDHCVPARSRKIIPTGITVEFNGPDDKEYYLRIAPRSGLSAKNSIDIGAGVVDWDYRGQIYVCFINNSDIEYQIKSGDRIAQMILERINRFISINEIFENSETTRGKGGFGSTGK